MCPRFYSPKYGNPSVTNMFEKIVDFINKLLLHITVPFRFVLFSNLKPILFITSLEELKPDDSFRIEASRIGY